jgi:hypothetical protein
MSVAISGFTLQGMKPCIVPIDVAISDAFTRQNVPIYSQAISDAGETTNVPQLPDNSTFSVGEDWPDGVFPIGQCCHECPLLSQPVLQRLWVEPAFVHLGHAERHRADPRGHGLRLIDEILQPFEKMIPLRKTKRKLQPVIYRCSLLLPT